MESSTTNLSFSDIMINISAEEHFRVSSCGKNCVCYPYTLKASSYLFKRVDKDFFLKK